MVRNTFSISRALNRVIRDAKMRLDTRKEALAHLVALALADKKKFVKSGRFEGPGEVSVTCTMDEDAYKATLPYRQKYDIEFKRDFFMHALVHGATLYEAQNPKPEPTEDAS